MLTVESLIKGLKKIKKSHGSPYIIVDHRNPWIQILNKNFKKKSQKK